MMDENVIPISDIVSKEYVLQCYECHKKSRYDKEPGRGKLRGWIICSRPGEFTVDERLRLFCCIGCMLTYYYRYTRGKELSQVEGRD